MPEKEISIQEKIKLAINTYNKYASIYAEHTRNKLLQFQLIKFESLLPKKGKVLDVGCGCGRDSAYLQEDGFQVSSVDISEGMIKEAKKLGINAVKGDILKMVSNEEFDGVWCMATLADIPKSESKKFIKKLNESLKKEGILYLAVKEGEGEELIEKEIYDNSPRFYAFYKQEELEKLLQENGFEVLESTVSNDEGTSWVEVFAKKN